MHPQLKWQKPRKYKFLYLKAVKWFQNWVACKKKTSINCWIVWTVSNIWIICHKICLKILFRLQGSINSFYICGFVIVMFLECHWWNLFSIKLTGNFKTEYGVPLGSIIGPILLFYLCDKSNPEMKMLSLYSQ